LSDAIGAGELDQGAWDALEEMVGHDADFLAEMIDTFLSDAPGLIADLNGAIASGDAAALRRAAHTLKSNSRTFGARRLGDLGQAIEEHAASGRIAETVDLVISATDELESVSASLLARKGAF
jgi:HPt (histidine-containing phosphotransfer) domain-containing protein